MNKDKLEKIFRSTSYNLKDYQKFISINIDTSNDLDLIKQSLVSFINKNVLGFL